jgi:hypothetical protein
MGFLPLGSGVLASPGMMRVGRLSMQPRAVASGAPLSAYDAAVCSARRHNYNAFIGGRGWKQAAAVIVAAKVDARLIGTV